EVPPAHLLVVVVATLAARGDNLPDLRAEIPQVVVGEIEVAAEEAAEIVERDARVGDRAGGGGGEVDRPPPVPVQLTARRVHQVVGDRSGWPVRDPAHGVGDVAVEAGEEAKAVFAGEVAAALFSRPGHREAPGL